ncbi:MAG: hypothetical protein ACKVW3_13830, partial [Phycisphaerales bacterium]
RQLHLHACHMRCPLPKPAVLGPLPRLPPVVCTRCGKPAIRIVIAYDKVPTPPKSGQTASSW